MTTTTPGRARPVRVLRPFLPALVGAVVAALLATLLGAPSAARAAVAPAAGQGVSGADLPTTGQVARIFPFLAGGSRALDVGGSLDLYDETCVGLTNGFPARSVRRAAYLDADGDVPYFEGRQDPTFVVYEFGSPRRARAGFQALVDYATRCEGTASALDTTRTLTPVAVPALGERRLAFRTGTRYLRSSVARNLEVYVLRGRRIERSWIQRDTGGTSRRHAVRMARLLGRTAA
ncbi:hypothetical protein [Nocardioides dongxiaopingii]|uniref:hypothetical protein n=1 Tax=Nocardioides dongxiaopingii TaxID=2576036 RepID=UPI0010C766FA|nr:hypothetical protein [Nocardioides dongxiaopingii]